MEHVLKRLAWTDRLSADEQDQLIGSFSRVQSFAVGQTIVPAEVPVDFSSIILQGISSRQKVLESGGRQITAFHITGDFCDLHTYVLKTLPDSVVAMSECEVVTIPHNKVDSIFRSSHHMAQLFWASTLIDAGIFRQWIISIGRRSPPARLAHLFCELFLRFEVVGLTKDLSYPLPVTQTDLSDVLGLSLVHTNRTCAALREAGLATFSQRRVIIHDWEGLQRVAEFNPEYLHLQKKIAIAHSGAMA
jgi:CRP-like cAMP-binding protein